MTAAIGLIELTSIARGIETCDDMVKAAQVDLLRATTVCPGKYIVLVGGDTGDVKEAIKAGQQRGAEYVVDTLIIPNVHHEVMKAISMTNEVSYKGAVGVLEFYSIAAAVIAADVAAKAADVTLIEVRTGYAIGGKGFVTLTGDIGAVKAAVDAASKDCELLVQTAVLPRPDPKLFETLL